MRDLNQIEQTNTDAAEAEGITAARKAGKFVVQEFAGLAYVGHTQHDDLAAANSHATSITGDSHKPTARTKVLPPIATGIVGEHFDVNTAAGGVDHAPV